MITKTAIFADGRKQIELWKEANIFKDKLLSKRLQNHFLRLKFCGIKNNTYICVINIKTIRVMPEVFRFFGFSFFYYSKEHEPVHIHVEGNDGMAKFDWDATSLS
jgi:hypothetical protein